MKNKFSLMPSMIAIKRSVIELSKPFFTVLLRSVNLGTNIQLIPAKRAGLIAATI